MNNPQYLNNPIIIGAPASTSPSQINPGSPGVNFNDTNAAVIIPFAPGITPILVDVSVPNNNTNVKQITVTVTAPSGVVLFSEVSPPGTNKVDKFPTTPLPESSTVTITFQAANEQIPQAVTISITGCYTPATATTVVTSSTVPPTVSGTTSTLTISSTSTGVTKGKHGNVLHWVIQYMR